VTPKQLENLAEFIGGDMELLEGFDALDEELQTKVKRAIEQGHVDDDDWKGDPEQNRPGKRGKFTPTPRKKKAQPENDDGEPPSPTPKKSKSRKKKAIKDESPANGLDALPTTPEPNGDGAEAPRKPAKTRKRKAKVEDQAVKLEEVDPAYEPNEQSGQKKSKRATKKSAARLDNAYDSDLNPVATETTNSHAKPKRRGRRSNAPNATKAEKGAAEEAIEPSQEPGHADEEPCNADEVAPRKISRRAVALGQPTAASSRSRRGVKSAET
jgi:hypothetical protein